MRINRTGSALLWLLMLLCLLPAGFAQETTPEATPEPVSTQSALKPFFLTQGGLAGLRPADWQQLRPGTYFQPETQNALIYRVSTMNRRATAESFLMTAGLEELPPVSETLESPGLAWDIYAITAPDNGAGEFLIAISESADEMLYFVALQADPDDFNDLRENVFYPALQVFGQPLDAVYTAAGLPPVEQVLLTDPGLAVVIPQTWEPDADNSSLYRAPADDTATPALLNVQSVSVDADEAEEAILPGVAQLLPADVTFSTEDEDTLTHAGAYLEWSIVQAETDDNSYFLAETETSDLRYQVLFRAPADSAERLYQQMLLPLLDVAYAIRG